MDRENEIEHRTEYLEEMQSKYREGYQMENSKWIWCKDCGHEKEVSYEYILKDDDKCEKCSSYRLTLEED